MSDELRTLVEAIGSYPLEARAEIANAAERIEAIVREGKYAMIALALVGQSFADGEEVPNV